MGLFGGEGGFRSLRPLWEKCRGPNRDEAVGRKKLQRVLFEQSDGAGPGGSGAAAESVADVATISTAEHRRLGQVTPLKEN